MVKYHYIYDMIENNKIKIIYLPTSDMIVDPLTKDINKELFSKHVSCMG
jgi:predicted transcriptional regulator